MSSLSDGLDPNTGNIPGQIMNSLPSNVAAHYLDRLNFWRAKLAILDASYDKIASSSLDEYTLTSGDGMTRAKRRNLEEMGKQLSFVESRVQYFHMKLYGRGVMTQRFRRKG